MFSKRAGILEFVRESYKFPCIQVNTRTRNLHQLGRNSRAIH